MLNETDVVVVRAVIVMLADAVPPGPVSVELIAPVVLFLTPVVVPVTLTVMVQLPLAARVPPLSEILPEPATAVTVPPHVLVSPFGVATTNPAGRLSLNERPVSPRPLFGLLILNVNEVVSFNGIEATPNALVIVGADATVMLAVAVLPVPPLVV